MEERLFDVQEVEGSIPSSGTKIMTHEEARYIFEKWRNCKNENCKNNPSNSLDCALKCCVCEEHRKKKTYMW